MLFTFSKSFLFGHLSILKHFPSYPPTPTSPLPPCAIVISSSNSAPFDLQHSLFPSQHPLLLMHHLLLLLHLLLLSHHLLYVVAFLSRHCKHSTHPTHRFHLKHFILISSNIQRTGMPLLHSLLPEKRDLAHVTPVHQSNNRFDSPKPMFIRGNRGRRGFDKWN